MRAPRFRSSLLALGLLLAGCHGDRDAIGKDLKSDRPEVRASAVHRLADLHDEQDLPVFIARTQDFSASVRKAAADALGGTTDPRAIDVLGTLLTDPDDDVQVAAATSLAKFPSDKANVYLLNAYARRGTATRAAIAKAWNYGPKLQEAIRREADSIWDRNVKALENGGGAEKVGAAEELGRSGKPEAVEKLVPLLGNDAILLAAGAARGLGDAGDRKAAAPLMAVLRENYPALREAAADALGELGDPQSLPVLTQVALGADAASTEAVAAIARLPRAPDSDGALCQVASAGSPSSAVLAAKTMGPRGGCPLPPLMARLSKGGTETRAALGALQSLDAGKPEVVAKLSALVDDKDPAVRSAAVQALGAVGSAEAAPALLKVVQAEQKRLDESRAKWIPDALPREYQPGFGGVNPDDPGYRQKLTSLEQKVHAVNQMKAAAAGQVLHEARPEKPREVIPDTAADDSELLATALAALGRTRAPEAAPLLDKAAVDADDAVREGALVGLAYLGGAGLKKVQAGWGDLSPEGVTRVADGLRTVGAPAVPVLIAGLNARSSERSAIALALGQLGAKEAVDPLEKLLGSAGDECAAAAQALGMLGENRSVKPLVDLLRDPRAGGRLQAVEALGRIKDPSAKDALVRELWSDRPEMRAAAVRALAAIGGASGTTGLEALRADYYREVRRAVEQVLGAATASK